MPAESGKVEVLRGPQGSSLVVEWDQDRMGAEEVMTAKADTFLVSVAEEERAVVGGAASLCALL